MYRTIVHHYWNHHHHHHLINIIITGITSPPSTSTYLYIASRCMSDHLCLYRTQHARSGANANLVFYWQLLQNTESTDTHLSVELGKCLQLGNITRTNTQIYNIGYTMTKIHLNNNKISWYVPQICRIYEVVLDMWLIQPQFCA